MLKPIIRLPIICPLPIASYLQIHHHHPRAQEQVARKAQALPGVLGSHSELSGELRIALKTCQNPEACGDQGSKLVGKPSEFYSAVIENQGGENLTSICYLARSLPSAKNLTRMGAETNLVLDKSMVRHESLKKTPFSWFKTGRTPAITAESSTHDTCTLCIETSNLTSRAINWFYQSSNKLSFISSTMC